MPKESDGIAIIQMVEQRKKKQIEQNQQRDRTWTIQRKPGDFTPEKL
jgi:hypothetical protein